MLTVTSAVAGRQGAQLGRVGPLTGRLRAAVISAMVALLQLMSVRSSRRLRATRKGSLLVDCRQQAVRR